MWKNITTLRPGTSRQCSSKRDVPVATLDAPRGNTLRTYIHSNTTGNATCCHLSADPVDGELHHVLAGGVVHGHPTSVLIDERNGWGHSRTVVNAERPKAAREANRRWCPRQPTNRTRVRTTKKQTSAIRITNYTAAQCVPPEQSSKALCVIVGESADIGGSLGFNTEALSQGGQNGYGSHAPQKRLVLPGDSSLVTVFYRRSSSTSFLQAARQTPS